MTREVRRRARITLRRFWHAHRWHLAVALVAIPVLAVMVHSAIGRGDPRAQMPSRAEVCAATDQATDQVAARYPDAPKERLDELAEEVCRPATASSSTGSRPST